MSLSIGTLVGYVELDTSGVESSMDKLEGMFNSSGATWGKSLGFAGAAAGALFGASLVGAINLEPGRDKIAASLDLTTKQAEVAGQVAGDVYAGGWGDSADDVNGAIESVISSIGGMRNASAADLEATTIMAMDFATAMEQDVGKAAQVAGVMVKTGLADNATQAFDLLTEASSRVPKELRGDVLDATEEYAQFFTAVGMDGPEAMAMLAEGAKKGQYGLDKAGDAVKEFTIRSTDMSTASVEAYDAIGLNAGKMANDMLAGGDRARGATDKIVDGLLGLKDPAERANASIALFGTPLEDMSTKDIPTFLKSLKSGGEGLDGFEGATDRMGKTLNDNASTNLTSFGRQLKSTFVETLGGTVLPTVTQWSAVLAEKLGPALSLAGSAISSVTGFLSRHATIVGSIAGLIGAVFVPGLIALAASQTAAGIAAAAGWATQTAGAVAASAAHSIAVARMVAGWVMMGVQSMLAAVKIAAAWLVAMGPIALVGAAVVALVALVVKNWDTIKATTVEAWDAVKRATSRAWDGIKVAVSKVIDALVSIFLNFTGPGIVIKHWDTIKSATGAAWSWVKSKVSAVIDGITSVVSSGTGAVRSTVTSVWGAIKGATSAVWGAIKSVIDRQVQGVKNIINGVRSIVGKIRGFFQSAKEAAVGKLLELVTWLRSLPGKIKSAVGNLGSILYDAGASVLQGLIDGIASKWDDLKGLLSKATGMIPDWKGPMTVDAKLLTPNGAAIMDSLVDGFEQSMPRVESTLRGLTGDMSGMLEAPAPVGGARGDRDGVSARDLARLLDRPTPADPELRDTLERVRKALDKLPRTIRQQSRQEVTA